MCSANGQRESLEKAIANVNAITTSCVNENSERKFYSKNILLGRIGVPVCSVAYGYDSTRL
jgi:hypothetical protein